MKQKSKRQSEIPSSGRVPPASRPPRPKQSAGLQIDKSELRLQIWLKQVGLLFDPFVPLDAGDDSRLSTYLIGSDIFEKALWGDWHSFLFAPQGGGKTAFRVRLAYECRTGGDGRQVFPIPYRMPRASTVDEHYEELGRAAAAELLLELAYRPRRFEKLSDEAKVKVKQAIEWNAPGLLEQFLPQLEEVQSPTPLVQYLDRSASHLPNLPDPSHVSALTQSLSRLYAAPPVEASPAQRFGRFLEVIRKDIQFQAVYILLDGIDGYPEVIDAFEAVLRWLDPIIALVRDLEAHAVYLKAFLPDKLNRLYGEGQPRRLTRNTKWANISWHPVQLRELLQMRIRAASQGEFDSLDAVSSPHLRNVEKTLVEKATPLPREVLALAHSLLVEHSRRTQVAEHLDQGDLDAALHRYSPHEFSRSTASL